MYLHSRRATAVVPPFEYPHFQQRGIVLYSMKVIPGADVAVESRGG